MTGVNIQFPWSNLLINYVKSIETRSYPLPIRYENKELALVETPGKNGKFKARIIGTVTFSHSFKYRDERAWLDDHNKHLVSQDDSQYKWNKNKPKYGWVVSHIKKFDKPVDISKRKGIIFTTGLLENRP